MIDLSGLKCHCMTPRISRGDQILAEKLGISDQEAHNLGDTFEEALDQALQEKWGSR